MSCRPLSLALRLTLLFGSATAIVLPLFGWLVIHSTERHFVAEDRDDLMVVASAVHDILHEGPLPAASERLERRIADVLIGHYDTALRLTAPDGRLVYASPGPDLTVAALVAASDPGTLTEQEYEGSTYRVLRQTLAIAGAPGQYRIAVAAPIDHHLRFLAEFRRTLWSMIIASIVFMS